MNARRVRPFAYAGVALGLGLLGGIWYARRNPALVNVRPATLTEFGIGALEYKRYDDLSHDVFYRGKRLDRDDVTAFTRELDGRNDSLRGAFAFVLAGAREGSGQQGALDWLAKRAGPGNSPLTRLTCIKTIYGMDPERAKALARGLEPEMNIPVGKLKIRQILDGTLDQKRYQGGVRDREKF